MSAGDVDEGPGSSGRRNTHGSPIEVRDRLRASIGPAKSLRYFTLVLGGDQELQGDAFGGSGDESVDLREGQVDPTFMQMGEKVGGVVHPAAGHKFGQMPGVGDRASRQVSFGSMPANASLTVLSRTRRKILTR